MSLGLSISDIILLSQLAWKTIQNSRRACSEHDSLTGEVSALHTVIRRIEQEIRNPKSPINVTKHQNDSKRELLVLMIDFEKLLCVLCRILNKYNTLSEQERRRRNLWQKNKIW